MTKYTVRSHTGEHLSTGSLEDAEECAYWIMSAGKQFGFTMKVYTDKPKLYVWYAVAEEDVSKFVSIERNY